MQTLRIEADYIISSSGPVSSTGFSSYEEAVAYATSSQLTAASGALSVDFVKYNSETGAFSGVFINHNLGGIYAKVVSDWYNQDFDLIPSVAITATHSISPSGTYVSELSIPSDVMAAIGTCDHVFYYKTGGGGVENFGITMGTNPMTGDYIYRVSYGSYSATNSNIRAFISGHGLIFDSSAPDPDPYDWGPPQYAAALVWSAPPDIFWTNRVLCEETPS